MNDFSGSETAHQTHAQQDIRIDNAESTSASVLSITENFGHIFRSKPQTLGQIRQRLLYP